MRRLILAGLGIAALLIATFQLPLASAPGEAASRDIAKAATLVYVSLRAVNAALSVAQEIEVGAQALASATTQPLKVLDPVDDTIERIAAVVFTVAAASWVLSVAFLPVSVIGFYILGAGLIGLSLAPASPVVSGASRALARFGLIAAIILPLLYSGGVALGRYATETIQTDAMRKLDGVADEARTLIGRRDDPGATETPSQQGVFARVFGGMSSAAAQVDSLVDAADYYWSEADAVLQAAFTLIAVFVLRMLILPGLLLLLFWRLAGRVW